MTLLRKLFKTPSIDQTKRFYTDLVSGESVRGLWGKDNRFDPARHQESENIARHFVSHVKKYIGSESHVLDLGCGSGVFLVHLARLCRKVIGADISKSLTDIASHALRKLRISNVEVVGIDGGTLDFVDESFDGVVMVDVIHHLGDIASVLDEAHRVLKPAGKLLIFEPNKLNPALFLMCVLDRNEWGLLSLGTQRTYRNALASSRFQIESFEFCGLLIGPDSKWAFVLANFLLTPPFSLVFKFLSPKVFIVASKTP